METTTRTVERDAVLVEDAHVRPMMGLEVLEPVPARNVPYQLSDPYILVHEATVPITPERAKLDTTHPHRGFDNLWYILSGDASTGHSTGPGGTFERAQLGAGGLLKIRTGRGVNTPRASARTSWPRARQASSAACCSGSTSPARTSRPSQPPRSWSRNELPSRTKLARSSARSSGPARLSSSERRG